MQINSEAWSISKTIITGLFGMLIAVGIWNFQQLDTKVSRLEAHYVVLDKEKLGKQDLKEAVETINQRMDAMGNNFANMQNLQTQNILLRIETQQQTLARLEALLSIPQKK